MVNFISLYIDSEFEEGLFLTLQILLKTSDGLKLYVYYNSSFLELFESKKEIYFQSFQNSFPNLPTPIFVPWNYEKENMKLEEMIFTDLLKKNGIIKDELEKTLENYRVQISFFYSLRDLYYLFFKKVKVPFDCYANFFNRVFNP